MAGQEPAHPGRPARGAPRAGAGPRNPAAPPGHLRLHPRRPEDGHGPMAVDGQEPVGSMGDDAPLAVLSNQPQLLYNYFKQLFAQVTNPPIDAIRESFVTSTTTYLGAQGNLLHPTETSCRRIRLNTPILSNQELAALNYQQSFKVRKFPIVFPINGGRNNLEMALNDLFIAADLAIQQGVSLIILSDKGINENQA